MSQYGWNPDGPGVTYQRYIRVINNTTSLVGTFDTPALRETDNLLLGIDATILGILTGGEQITAQLGGCTFWADSNHATTNSAYFSWRGQLVLANLLDISISVTNPAEMSILAWGVNLGYSNPSFYDPPTP